MDLLKELDDLGIEQQPGTQQSGNKRASTSATPKAAPSTDNAKSEDDENLFGDIEKHLSSKPQPASSSRPATPRVSSSSTSAATSRPEKHTPMSSKQPSARTSEEQARASGERARVSMEKTRESSGSQRRSEEEVVSSGGGGGWWGMVSGAATAARKQAESLAKSVQSNEEAQKWASQVQGRLGGLSHLGG